MLILFSGGAVGADSEFDRIGKPYLTETHHFWHGKITPLGNHQISDIELAEGMEHVHKANLILKRGNYEKYSSLLGRNWFQTKYSFNRRSACYRRPL